MRCLSRPIPVSFVEISENDCSWHSLTSPSSTLKMITRKTKSVDAVLIQLRFIIQNTGAEHLNGTTSSYIRNYNYNGFNCT